MQRLILFFALLVGENKQQMVVLGTQNGIYMGKESDTNGMKMVLMISDVTQIGVLQAENILLVLAGNHCNIKLHAHIRLIILLYNYYR